MNPFPFIFHRLCVLPRVLYAFHDYVFISHVFNCFLKIFLFFALSPGRSFYLNKYSCSAVLKQRQIAFAGDTAFYRVTVCAQKCPYVIPPDNSNLG